MAARATPAFGAATSTVLLPLLKGAPVGGHVLGASSKGIYVLFDSAGKADENPDVLAILPASSVWLPLAMVTAEPLPAIAPDDPTVLIAAGDGMLQVGPYVWRPARWFDPRPVCPRPPEPGALAEAAESLWNLSVDALGLPVIDAWRAAAALASGDVQPCRALIGGGPGLTPAGDDVVAGALAACALFDSGSRHRDIGLLLAHANLATTSLSAALLRCAARGQVVPQAAELLRALGSGAAIAPALGHLRAVGSTSGTALAVGLVAALTVATTTVGSVRSNELPPQRRAHTALAACVSATERPQ